MRPLVLSLAASFLCACATHQPPAPNAGARASTAAALRSIFDGKTFDGWEHDPAAWTIENGALRGTAKYGQAFTKADYGDFRLIVTARVVVPEENTGWGHLGILFWGDRPAPDKWNTAGALQVQPPHGAMWDYRTNKDVRPTRVIPRLGLAYHDWHTAEVLARLSTGEVRMAVDGVEIVRYKDPDPTARRRGPIGFQIHSDKSVVEYKDVRVEVDPKDDVLFTVRDSTPEQRAAVPPLYGVFAQFTAPDVPARGPAEAEPIPRSWPEPEKAPERPGRGLGQHPMLYAGEGYNTLFLVVDGKVVWTYHTVGRGEIDDVWMMTNGHVLYTRQYYVEEITPSKDVVWHYDAPEGTEIHSAQPIGLDKVLIVRNGLPPKAMIFDKKTGAVEMEHDLPALSLTDPKTVHPQFRRIRMTAKGTFLASFLKMDKVVEYDQAFHEVWSYEIPTPWAATRLHNGNTLIVDEHDRIVREVGPKGETVWEFNQADLPADVSFRNIQTAERLASGNTVIFSSTGGAKKEDRPALIQAVEVTPDKKVVWVLQDWKNLGPATTAQFLDQPGTPETPGDLQH
jgi:hypothetical protein